VDSRTPPELAYLRDKCWHGDPLERPTFSDVLVKLSDLMLSIPATASSAMREPTPTVENASGGQYSDQFSSVPQETLSRLWERKCRKLSELLLLKPKVDELLSRRVSPI
jgi:hypothetical protein